MTTEYTEEHLTLHSPPLAATADRSHPLIISWLVKRKAYLPNKVSARTEASGLAGPQIVKVAENLSSAGCALGIPN